MEFGYFNPEDSEAQNTSDLRNQNSQLNTALHSQMGLLSPEVQDNLVRWQLDLREDLERIEHLLKGDKESLDKEGNIIFVSVDDPDLQPFNEYGVKMIMNVLSFYLNRNTLLSNYDENTINWKILDFGMELCDLIFNKYEAMMNTLDVEEEIENLIGKEVIRLKDGRYVVKISYSDGEVIIQEIGENVKDYVEGLIRHHLKEKIKLFPMIHKQLTDSVHSAYLRAYHGGERESLRTARTVTQSEPLYRQNPEGFGQPQRVKKWYNPGTW